MDATGTYLTRDGKTVRFKGARELAAFLADSAGSRTARSSSRCSTTWSSSPSAAFGPDTREELRASFAANKFHVRELAVEIMTKTALKPRRVHPPTPKPLNRTDQEIERVSCPATAAISSATWASAPPPCRSC